MKAWLKGLVIGQILFIIYAIVGAIWSNPPRDYETIIYAFIIISFYATIIGLYIDSIKLKWASWIQGGLSGLVLSNPFLFGAITYIYFASNIPSCNSWPFSCPLSQNIIIAILNLIIFFTIGALIGLIFGKRKSRNKFIKPK